MVSLGEEPREKWPIRTAGTSVLAKGSRAPATSCKRESLQNSKIVRCSNGEIKKRMNRSIDRSKSDLLTCLEHFDSDRTFSLRRRRNGWARNQVPSMGSVLGDWSSATDRQRWLQDTFLHLCANFGSRDSCLTKLALDQALHTCTQFRYFHMTNMTPPLFIWQICHDMQNNITSMNTPLSKWFVLKVCCI